MNDATDRDTELRQLRDEVQRLTEENEDLRRQVTFLDQEIERLKPRIAPMRS